MRRTRFVPRLEPLGVRAVPSADVAGVLVMPAVDVAPVDPGGPATVDMTAAVEVAPTDAY